MKNLRDRQYWEEMFNAFYIEQGFGRYDEAFDAFCEKYAEFAEFCRDYSADKNRSEFVKRIGLRYREADHREHEAAPTPEHLRQQFLPFLIDIPPMSHSVNGWDGQGRVGQRKATLKQHRNHHRGEKQYHHRGFVYREAAETAWNGLMEIIRQRYPDIEQPDQMTLDELLACLKARGAEDQLIDEVKATAPPTL